LETQLQRMSQECAMKISSNIYKFLIIKSLIFS